MADFKILAFKNPELKILADFKILAFYNPEFKIFADFKILAFQNPEFKIWAFQNPEYKISIRRSKSKGIYKLKTAFFVQTAHRTFQWQLTRLT